jgi:hypothetical protein
MGALMFSRHDDFATSGPSRETVAGFSAIAAALEHGLDAKGTGDGRIVDVLAIGFGWLVLIAIIFYPALQLAAIAIGVTFICMRSFMGCVLGSALSSAPCSPGFSPRDRPSLRAA